MSLKEITLKLVMLLALTSGQRVRTLATLSKKGMIHSDSGVGFVLTGLVKTISPKNANVQINLPFYTKHELCVVRCLQEYLKRTNPLSSSDRLLVSYITPHGPVEADTISRWLKTTLKDAGICTTVFTAHSTRAVAASCAARSLDIGTIMASVGWKSSQTFQRFYHKPTKHDAAAFPLSIMNSSSNIKTGEASSTAQS